MKKILFVIFGIIVVGIVFTVKANAQMEATSDLWCDEAPAGTPVCNVVNNNGNWYTNRIKERRDEVCCVSRPTTDGGRVSTSDPKSAPKTGPKVNLKTGPKVNTKTEDKKDHKVNKMPVKPAPKAQQKMPEPVKVVKPTPKISKVPVAKAEK